MLTALKRKRHILLPILVILSIIGFVHYSSSILFNTSSNSNNSSFLKLQIPISSNTNGKAAKYVPKFKKLTFIDYDFDFTKVTYTSTNEKFTSTYKSMNRDDGIVEDSSVNYFPGKQTILIMSVIGNSSPYGRDRNFEQFLKTILSIVEDQSDYIISLSLLCNNPDEFNNIQKYFENELENNLELFSTLFESIIIVSAPFLDENSGFNRNERHRDSIQRLRRRLIAKSRNFLLLHSLNNQQYILTIDSDMIRFDNPEKFISRFINSKKDIVVPRIERPGLKDYDKNSWRGERTKPNQEQLDKMDNNQWDQWDYVPRDVQNNMYHFQTYIDNKDNEFELHKDDPDYIIPLDSVGGAVLFMKSIVIKQGVIFPTSLIVGTTWDRQEGYDGIETEGVCYLVKPLGFSCWGMPNIVAHHTG